MFKFTTEVSLTGYSLVLPSVSVGNVAQLAVDLLIETLKMPKVGLLWHPALIPVVGPPAYDHDQQDKLTTTAELYASTEHRLLVVQIRAPLVGALQADFLDRLTDFLQTRVYKVIVLASSFAHENHQVGARPYKYLANEKFLSCEKETLDQLKWDKLDGTTTTVIHGGGYAKKLLEACTAKELACFVLFIYVSEGDNTPDAVQLVSLLDQLKQKKLLPRKADGVQVKLAIPSSWKHLFGNAAPVNVY